MARVSIIIPVFNAPGLTGRCLNALGNGGFEVVVVDDGSTDATARCLAAFAKRLKVLRHCVNRGFAASCNDGAAAASGEYLVFLNNDTLPKPGWLEALVGYADHHPAAAIVGGKLLYPDNTVQHAGVVVCQDRYPRHLYTGFPAGHPAVNKSRRFQIVTAACMLVRRAAFEEAHGFDTGYRNGFEDVDFCLRLGESGYEVHYCAGSVVEHLESVSPGRFKHERHNVARYRDRWLPSVQPDDLRYYLEDGLLRFNYEGSFPIRIEVSPRLALLDRGSRRSKSELLLSDQARQLAELRREQARYSSVVANAFPDSVAAQYAQLRTRVAQAIGLATTAGTTVLVVSKGDGALLELRGRNGWHFPQTKSGAYSGYHPADSDSAIAHLEKLRAGGADYLVFPSTAFWWLEHYQQFERHLRTRYAVVLDDPETCLIFRLRPGLGRQPTSSRCSLPLRAEIAANRFAGAQQEGRSN